MDMWVYTATSQHSKRQGEINTKKRRNIVIKKVFFIHYIIKEIWENLAQARFRAITFAIKIT